MTAMTDVPDLIQRWAAAEERNDPDLLDGLLTDDFTGVGPAGFVLDRGQWLVRFENGLVNDAFAVEDAKVRDYGDTAVAVGVLAQRTRFHGQDNSGRFRLTIVAARPVDHWLLAGVHIGPLQAPPGGGS